MGDIESFLPLKLTYYYYYYDDYYYFIVVCYHRCKTQVFGIYFRNVRMFSTTVNARREIVILACDNQGQPIVPSPKQLNFLNTLTIVTRCRPPLLKTRAIRDCWVTAIKSYSSVMSAITDAGFKIHQTGIPVPLLDFCSQAVPLPLAASVIHPNNPVWPLLKPHQKEAFLQIEGFDRGGMNASAMGTGKTAVTICSLWRSFFVLGGCNQLVVCPSSLRHNWAAEIDKFAPSLSSHILFRGTDLFLKAKVNIISYSLLRSVLKSEQKKRKEKKKKPVAHDQEIPKHALQFHVLILDESHFLKSTSAQRTQVITRLSKSCTKVFLLSGTPAARPGDLFSQLRILDPRFFKTFYPFQGRGVKDLQKFYFAARYCDPQKVYIHGGSQVTKFTGCTSSWELHELLKYFVVRKTLADLPVNEQLQDKIRERVMLAPMSSTKQKKFSTELGRIRSLREKKQNQKADVSLMELTRETCRQKLKSIQTYIKELITAGNLSEGNKFLFFAHHGIMLDAVAEVLEETKTGFIRLDGKTPMKERQSLVECFQTMAEIKAAVLSILAAGTGLNFTSANHVIFCELLWSDRDMLQAEQRAQRMGQTRQVTVRYLMLPGSTDDLLWGCVNKKIGTSGRIIDNKRKYLTGAIVPFQGATEKKQKQTEAE